MFLFEIGAALLVNSFCESTATAVPFPDLPQRRFWSQLLEAACKQFKLDDTLFELTYKGKPVDPALTIRLGNFPHGTKLELARFATHAFRIFSPATADRALNKKVAQKQAGAEVSVALELKCVCPDV